MKCIVSAVTLLLSALTLPGLAQNAPANNDKVDTLVGRGDKATVVSNGQTREIDVKKLPPSNRAGTRAPAAQKEQAQEAKPVKAAKEPAKETEEEKAKKAKAEEVKMQDVDRLRTLQKQGAWFYTDQNVPVPPEELKKRLESGNVADLKAVDIHLQEFKTETEPEEGKTEKVQKPATAPSGAAK